MKNTLILFLLFLTFDCIQAQVPSSCTVPESLANEYERDINTLTMRRMFELQSPDAALIKIPQIWRDTIAEGLSAIFNAISIPERDSVFNLYCVHALTGAPLLSSGPLYRSLNEVAIKVDTNYAWTQAWQDLNAISGNTYIDSLVIKYDLHVSQFYNWIPGSYALIQSDSLWNIYALIDSLEHDPALSQGWANFSYGTAGAITYKKIGSDRYYYFSYQWYNCMDGCDNQHTWEFKVSDDCSVDYLGYTDWGAFGILPLPEPVNCNLFTSVKEKDIEKAHYIIFPNPATDFFTIKTASNLTGSTYVILDQTGRQVLTGELNGETTSVDISRLASGFYLLQLGQQRKQTFKVIKN